MDSHNQASPDPTIPAVDNSAVDNSRGRTVIAETAVAKVVGIAARGVAGVHALGTGASRSMGAIRDVVGATDHTQGVRVEVGESQVAVDIVLVAEYGQPLQSLANTVRRAVYLAVGELVGRDVIEVNIEIADVFVASSEPDRPAARVRLSERKGAAEKLASSETLLGNETAVPSGAAGNFGNNPLEAGQ